MKDYIQFETKIGKNSGSYRTSIPREIIEYFEITTDEKLLWRIYFKTNTITLIPTSKESENAPTHIDETTEKTEKKATTNSETETTSTIKEEHEKYYEKLKETKQHTTRNSDNTFKLTIQKNNRKHDTNSFKIEFKDAETNQEITKKTIGKLQETIQELTKLSEYNKKGIIDYIQKMNNESAIKKLKEMKYL